MRGGTASEHRAVLTFELPSASLASVHAAVSTETANPDDSTGLPGEVPRSRAICRVDGSALVIELVSDDLAGLRAAVNSYLRWVDAAARAADLAARAQ